MIEEVLSENTPTEEIVEEVGVNSEEKNNIEVETEEDTVEKEPVKYKYKGASFTTDKIQEAADVDGLSIDEYLERHKDIIKIPPIEDVDVKISFEDFKLKSEEKIVPELNSLYPNFVFKQVEPGSDSFTVINKETGTNETIKLGTIYNTKSRRSSGDVNIPIGQEGLIEEDALSESKKAYNSFINFINDNPEFNEESNLIYKATGEVGLDGIRSIKIGTYDDQPKIRPVGEKPTGDFKGAGDAVNPSKEQAVSLITELDILQKDAFRNPWKYGIGNENTPGKEKFTLTAENHDQIKAKLIDELRTNTEIGIYKSSFDNMYNNLMAENKVFIEQEYDENRSISLSSIEVDEDFKSKTISNFNSKLTQQELKNQELSIKQGDISKDINILQNKIDQVNKKELTIEYDEEAKKNELKALDLQLFNKQSNYQVLQLQREENATTTTNIPGRFGEDFGSVEVKTTAGELTKNFFNDRGFSEASIDKLINIADDAQSGIEDSIKSEQESNPLLTQREAIGNIFNKEIINLQTLRKQGSESKIKLKIPSGFESGYTTLKNNLRTAGINVDKNGEVEISLLKLRQLGIDQRDFEGFFDEMLNMASKQDVEAIKIYNEEYDEVETLANAYWSMYAGNVDISAIEKDGFLKTLATSTFVSTLEKFGYNDKEAKNIVYSKGMSPQDRIAAINSAIVTSAYEVKSLSGVEIELTPEQKEAVKVSVSNQIAQGIGSFIPEMPLLMGGGQALNALGWKKYYNGLKGIKKFVMGAIVEDIQMQIALDAEYGTGAVFFSVGSLGRTTIKWGKNYRALQPVFQKLIASGPLGAVSSEVASAVSAVSASIRGEKNFETSIEELYGKLGPLEERIMVQTGIFSGFGAMGLKGNDVIPTSKKIELRNKLNKRIEDVRRGPTRLINGEKEAPGLLRDLKDLSPKEKEQVENLTSGVNELQNLIQYEIAYVELTPPSREKFESTNPETVKEYKKEVEAFKNNLTKRYVDPWVKGIQAFSPDFKGVNVVVGRGARFRKNNFRKSKSTAEFDPNTNTITIDMDLYTPGKEIHELTHLLQKEYYKKNPAALENLAKDGMSQFYDYQFGEFSGKELEQRIIDKYNINTNAPEGKKLLAEEYLSFMGEYLSSPEAYYTNPALASSLLNEIKLEIKDILIQTGVKSPLPKTAKDVVENIGILSRKGIRGQGGAESLVSELMGFTDKKSIPDVDIDNLSNAEANRKADKANIEKEIKSSLDLEGTVVKKTTKEIVEDNRKLRAEILKNPDGKPNRKQRDQIVDNNKNLIYNSLNKYETITGFKLSKDIKEEAAFELQLKLYEYAERYDANKNDVGAYLNMGFTKQVVNTLKKVGSFDREISESDLGDGESGGLENLVDQTFSTSGDVSSIPEKFIDPATGKLDVTTVLQEPEASARLLDNRIEDSNLIIESYKTTPDLSNISKDFGVKDGKINNEDGTFKGKTSTRLSQKEVTSAQQYIVDNAEMLYQLLPDGKTTKTAKESLKETSTGVQKVLLDAFYKQGDRVSTGAGLKGQEKLPFNRSKFLEYFGIKEDGSFETLKENGKIDQRIKALIHQDGKAVTNAQIRKIKELTANEIEDLKSGKSENLASMSLNDVDFLEEVVEKLNSGEKLTPKDIKALAAQRNASDFITKLSLTTTDEQKKAVVSHLQKFVVDPKIKIEREKQARREDMTLEEIEKEEELSISRWSKALPGLRKLSGFKDLQPIAPGTRSKNVTSAENRDRTIKSFNKILKKFPELLENDNFSKYVRNTFGEGSLKTFGLKKYKGKKGDAEYFGIAEFKDVFGKIESKGERLDFMDDVFMVNYSETGFKKKWEKEIEAAKVRFPLWESSQGEQYKSYLTSFGRDQLSNPKLVDANGKLLPDAYERTMDANREAIKYTYEKLSEVYKESPTKETLEDIITFLQIQTGQATGIIKGLAPMEYLSLIGEATRPGGKRFHNEHNKDLFIYNTEFVNLLLKSKNKIGNKKFMKELENITNSVSQSLTSDADRAVKDDPKYGGTGGSIDPIINDELLTTFLNPGSPSRTLSLRDFSGKNVNTIAKILLKRYGKKEAENILTKFPPSKAKVEVEQQIEYPRTEVVKNNVEVLKEASMSSKDLNQTQVVNTLKTRDKAISNARVRNKTVKKARVFDFDDTVARTNSKVFAEKDGERKVLTAEEFAKQGKGLVDAGWKMDFSDFNRVVEGKKGPLFELMKKIKESAGDRDMFILTARAPESAPAIKEFLDVMGIEIPLENITGLGNSTGEAKADWLVNKAAEGYNDFYFADDAPQNVKAVRDALEVLDVKSKTQQAYASQDLSAEFNKNIEESTGIGAEKVFSDIKAEIRGNKARKQKFFIPPSAEDFTGLLYTTLGKGKKGEAHMKFYQDNLLNPYSRAMENLSTDRVNLMDDFKALKKQLDVPKDLRLKTESGFTNEQAVRTYLWNKTGQEIPGISKTDLKELNDIVSESPKLQAFADQILSITKGDGYSKPGKNWAVGTITTDLMDLLNTDKRSKYLQDFNQNKDLIFSKDNLNKLEAAYGKKYRLALENSLTRMNSGSNRVSGGNKLSNDVLDYINNSTAVTMFLNTRSALLQTISSANYINWSFNNPAKAGAAFANQPQYWKDFTKLINSDYLKDRRNGLKLNINESEIADAAKTSKNKAKAALNYILEKGYAPTKYADSFAIASGGALFYRNRIKDLIKKEGKTEKEAEEIAMKEWRDVSELSQQSSDPSKISQQQSTDLGRVILQYVNTPMQYARMQKRDIQDIANKRRIPGKTLAESNRIRVSRIAYYGFLQNMMFNGLQQGAFALGFGDDESEMSTKQIEASDKDKDKKLFKVANGMIDSQLRGLGLGGVTLQVIKNLGIDIYDRSKKDNPEYSEAYKKLLDFSPSIKSKLTRFQSAAYPFDSKKRKEEVFEKGFSLDNPAYESAAKVITATTNFPLDRMYRKVENLKAAAEADTEAWQAVALLLGWPAWQIKNQEKIQPPKSRKIKIRSGVKAKSGKKKIVIR
jgi:hypothetical protein